MILDGWGKGDGGPADVVSRTETARMDELEASYPNASLLTSGEAVGLPEGQMGNSEVGHLNIGAGRVVYQDLVKINRAIREGSLVENEALSAALEYAKESGKKVHFMGLLSDGGVHSHDEHLYALCEISERLGVKEVFIHGFGDGRDTDPKSGEGYVRKLLQKLEGTSVQLASFVGRYYAMDRDQRWERIKVAYDLLVNGQGRKSRDIPGDIHSLYEKDITDEFMKPLVAVDEAGKPLATVSEGDVVIFTNFRNDRARELTIALTQKDLPEQGMHTMPLHYCTMTPYDATFKDLHVLFPKENVQNTLGEVISESGLRQLRIAETEKYAHVTFFFSGGREALFEGEDRKLIPSPRVATYDLKPEMSAPEVTEAVREALRKGTYDFICLNFANGDMVGHSGVYQAIEKAVKTVDACVGKVVDTAVAEGYEIVIIADHGNADHALNPDGSPNTAHSLNPVPLILISTRFSVVKKGILADVAPTILQLMGIEKPTEMTGKSLLTE